MATGVVRFFNAAKGFGLIRPDAGGKDLFIASLDIIGAKALKPSQKVQFEERPGINGPSAEKLRRID